MDSRQIQFSFCIILLTAISTLPALAQQAEIDTVIRKAQSDTSCIVNIVLQDGSEYQGYIAEADESQIELKSPNGTFLLNRARIQTITLVDEAERGSGWFTNPNATRLFFGSTGRPLEAGTGYYQNIYVFFSNIAIGAPNGFAGSLGFSMVPGIGLDNQLFVLTGKYGQSFNNKNHAAVGVSVISGAFLDDASEWPVITYGVYTYGTNNASVTVGGGLGFVQDNSEGALTLGGEYRVSERFSLVSENLYIPSVGDGILSYGIRFMGESISADLAFVRPAIKSADVGFGIPYVDFVVNF